MNVPAFVLPFVTVLLPWPPQLDDLFLAVNRRYQDAGIIAVFVDIGILHHHERPFTFVTFLPVERDSREIVAKIETNHHRTISLQRWPKYFLHKLRTRIQREAGRE